MELLQTQYALCSIFITLPSMVGTSDSMQPLIRTVSDGATNQRMLIARTEVVGGYLGVGIVLDGHANGISRSAIETDLCPARRLFLLRRMPADNGVLVSFVLVTPIMEVRWGHVQR